MRILARAPNWLGDAVMALPALEALGRAGDVLVHATSGAAGIFRSAGYAVEEIDPGFSFRAVGSVRRSNADAAVLLTNSFSSAAVAALGRAPRRIGFPYYARRLLLTDPVPVPETRPHQIDEYLLLARAAARALGRAPSARFHRPGEDDSAPAPRLDPPAWEVERWRARLGSGTRGQVTGTIGIAPGAAYGSAKRWPSDRWAALVRRLAAAGRRVALLGAPADRAAADEIIAVAGGGLGGVLVDLVGRTRTDDLPPLLAALDGLVTNDSGAAHIAAAVGTPVVALFGPTDPRRTAARGKAARHLWTTVECAPCHLRRCPIDHRCMRRVEPAAVEAALGEAIGAAGRPKVLSS